MKILSLLFLFGFPALGAAASGLQGVEKVEGDGFTKFANIAYAKPPVAFLRWKRPVPETALRQLKKSVSCPQFGSDSLPDEELPQREDCLYLNVWTPSPPPSSSSYASLSSGKKYPVLVWIHGGALLSGTGLKKFYDGAPFARAGMVFVSFNYRLGELGYGPKLSSEPGSLGLLDQLEAVRWVSKNIEALGGDPENIFLLGHSKGAEAILALLESGLAPKGVQGGIALSGARHFDFGSLGVAGKEAKFRGGEQAMSAEEILARVGYHVYTPELPAIRASGQEGPRYRVAITSLYDERFLEQPSTLYCGNRMAALQLFDYLEPSLWVLHPFRYEHGDEVRALFSQDKFGRALLARIKKFMSDADQPYRTSGLVEHLYPGMTLWGEDTDKGSYAMRFNCEDEAYPGTSKVSRRFRWLEALLRWMP